MKVDSEQTTFSWRTQTLPAPATTRLFPAQLAVRTVRSCWCIAPAVRRISPTVFSISGAVDELGNFLDAVKLIAKRQQTSDPALSPERLQRYSRRIAQGWVYADLFSKSCRCRVRLVP